MSSNNLPGGGKVPKVCDDTDPGFVRPVPPPAALGSDPEATFIVPEDDGNPGTSDPD